ncbi:MAG: acyl-CoA carboxylase subunit epsilon [Rhodoluna sp.]
MNAENNHEQSLQELMQVVRGEPTPEELAAVIAVLDAAHAEEVANAKGFERALKSTWSRNASQMRTDLVPGPGQWRGAYRSGLN